MISEQAPGRKGINRELGETFLPPFLGYVTALIGTRGEELWNESEALEDKDGIEPKVWEEKFVQSMYLFHVAQGLINFGKRDVPRSEVQNMVEQTSLRSVLLDETAEKEDVYEPRDIQSADSAAKSVAHTIPQTKGNKTSLDEIVKNGIDAPLVHHIALGLHLYLLAHQPTIEELKNVGNIETTDSGNTPIPKDRKEQEKELTMLHYGIKAPGRAIPQRLDRELKSKIHGFSDEEVKAEIRQAQQQIDWLLAKWQLRKHRDS